ncbi:hypothetical protein, partial [Escherichia coli]|uniref:hypothetical protein n=1 Tax=Escherichia coli TaxID=562 RepID=UPI003A978560
YDLSLFYLIFLYLIMHKGAIFMQKQSQLYPQPNYLPQYTQSTLILSKNSALLLVIPTKVGVIF